MLLSSWPCSWHTTGKTTQRSFLNLLTDRLKHVSLLKLAQTRLCQGRLTGCLSPPVCPRMYGRACATYESASLRMFRLGRTDTIRSTSVDSLKFVQSMDSPDKSVRISKKWSKRNPEKRKAVYLANSVSSGFS